MTQRLESGGRRGSASREEEAEGRLPLVALAVAAVPSGSGAAPEAVASRPTRRGSAPQGQLRGPEPPHCPAPRAAPSGHPWARSSLQAAGRSAWLGARGLILFTHHNPLQLGERRIFRLLLERRGLVGGEDWEEGVQRHDIQKRDLRMWMPPRSAKGCGHHCSRMGSQAGRGRLRGERETGSEQGGQEPLASDLNVRK